MPARRAGDARGVPRRAAARGRSESADEGARGVAARGRARQCHARRRLEASAPSMARRRRCRNAPWATARPWRRRRRRPERPESRRAPDWESPFSAAAHPACAPTRGWRGPSAIAPHGGCRPRGPRHGPAGPACRRQSRSRKSQAWTPGELAASGELYRNSTLGPADAIRFVRLDRWARKTPPAGRIPPRAVRVGRGYAAARRRITSAIAAEAKTRLTTPLMVKKARLTRERSLARTRDCSYASRAATPPTPT